MSEGPTDLRNAPRVVGFGNTDRPVPQTVESEEAVLGCVFLAPNESMDECITKGITKNWFYDVRNAELWDLLVSLYDKRVPIDLVSVYKALRDRGRAEQLTLTYLTTLPDKTPSAANLGYYIDAIKEKYLLRKMLFVCNETIRGVYECTEDVQDLLNKAEADITAVSIGTKVEEARSARDVVQTTMAKIEKLAGGDASFIGLPTGIEDIDSKILGMGPGEMIVIGARPSVGKTSLAMQIAEHVAIELNQPVGVFSLEMEDDALMLRAISGRSGINIKKVGRDLDVERDMPVVIKAAAALSGAPIFIDDTPSLTTNQFRSKARRMVSLHGIKLAVVDYLQLMVASGKHDNRQAQVAFISSEVKAAARELGIPVIVLAQLKRHEGRPTLEALRESGAIEQDADVVILLYTNEQGDDVDEKEVIRVMAYIAKQRNGEKGDVPLDFVRRRTRFKCVPRETEQQQAMI